MATIIARYNGTCAGCGQTIKAGEKIEWKKAGRQTYHLACAAIADEPAPYRLVGGEGYGYTGWERGQVVQATRAQRERGYPEFLYVVRAGAKYYAEDGMSFGVGDESGYVFWADCREATPEEAAPVIEQIRKRQEKAAAERRVEEIKRQIRQTGERPVGQHVPEGERILDTQTIYGGGDWFVIGPEHIWYVQNNGMDGDDWSRNNVRTGGAGAIGWRIPYDPEIDQALRDAAAMLEAK